MTQAPSGSIDGDPAFSPKGGRLAFLRSTSETTGDVFILSLSDHRIRRLTFLNTGIESPQWTADGQRVVFCLNPGVIGERRVFSVSAAGGEPERIPFISSDAGTPAIAPQGDKLAYAAVFFDSNVWKVALDDGSSMPAPAGSNGQKSQLVVASSRIDMQPQFSPDGTRLVYVSDRDGGMALWMSATDGSNPVRLISADGAGSPKWSPDGNFIVFDSLISGRRQIYVVSVNGGAPIRITNSDAENAVGSWSNDGKWIYFTSNRRGESQIWKSHFQDPSSPLQVTVNGGSFAQESPDGEYLYYQKPPDPKPQIWRMPAAGGKEEPVVECDTWFWAVRRDAIYFVTSQPVPAIKRFQLRGRRVEVVAKLKVQPWGRPGLAVSPNGRVAYYAQMDSFGGDVMSIRNFRVP